MSSYTEQSHVSQLLKKIYHHEVMQPALCPPLSFHQLHEHIQAQALWNKVLLISEFALCDVTEVPDTSPGFGTTPPAKCLVFCRLQQEAKIQHFLVEGCKQRAKI